MLVWIDMQLGAQTPYRPVVVEYHVAGRDCATMPDCTAAWVYWVALPKPTPLPYIETYPLPGRVRHTISRADQWPPTATRAAETNSRPHSRGRGGWCGQDRRRP